MWKGKQDNKDNKCLWPLSQIKAKDEEGLLLFVFSFLLSNNQNIYSINLSYLILQHLKEILFAQCKDLGRPEASNCQSK